MSSQFVAPWSGAMPNRNSRGTKKKKARGGPSSSKSAATEPLSGDTLGSPREPEVPAPIPEVAEEVRAESSGVDPQASMGEASRLSSSAVPEDQTAPSDPMTQSWVVTGEEDRAPTEEASRLTPAGAPVHPPVTKASRLESSAALD